MQVQDLSTLYMLQDWGPIHQAPLLYSKTEIFCFSFNYWLKGQSFWPNLPKASPFSNKSNRTKAIRIVLRDSGTSLGASSVIPDDFMVHLHFAISAQKHSTSSDVRHGAWPAFCQLLKVLRLFSHTVLTLPRVHVPEIILDRLVKYAEGSFSDPKSDLDLILSCFIIPVNSTLD